MRRSGPVEPTREQLDARMVINANNHDELRRAWAARIQVLEDALRWVQFEHSRAFIELSPSLEAAIVALIGPHPRDVGAPEDA